jgi:hypothetical protein
MCGTDGRLVIDELVRIEEIGTDRPGLARIVRDHRDTATRALVLAR